MRKNKRAEHVAYCGPTIPHVVRSFTVFEDTPEALKEQGSKCPAILALTVPLSQMAETRRALKMPGSRQAILYGHIQKFIQGGIR